LTNAEKLPMRLKNIIEFEEDWFYNFVDLFTRLSHVELITLLVRKDAKSNVKKIIFPYFIFFCIILFSFGRKTFVGSFLVEKFRQKSVMSLEGDSTEFYGREEEQKSIMPIQYFRL
jgi:hypothetical protein